MVDEEEEEVGVRDREGREQMDGVVVEVEERGRKEQERTRAPARAAANGSDKGEEPSVVERSEQQANGDGGLGRGASAKAGQSRAAAKKKRAKAAPFQFTMRDLELLAFLGRHRLATAEQLQRRFSLTESKAYARLRGLRARRLIRHERDVPGPGIFLATRAGLRLSDVDLAEASFSLATLRHDLAVADAAIELEREGHWLFSERELRRAIAEGYGEDYRIECRESGTARTLRHLPDLAVNDPDGRRFTAVEVELTQKRSERTRSILAGYRSAREGLQGVLYVVPSETARRRIEGLGRKVGLDGRLAVIRQGEPAGPVLEAIARSGEEREQRRAEQERRLDEERRQKEEAHQALMERLERERDEAVREQEQRGAEAARLSNRLRRRVLGPS